MSDEEYFNEHDGEESVSSADHDSELVMAAKLGQSLLRKNTVLQAANEELQAKVAEGVSERNRLFQKIKLLEEHLAVSDHENKEMYNDLSESKKALSIQHREFSTALRAATLESTRLEKNHAETRERLEQERAAKQLLARQLLLLNASSRKISRALSQNRRKSDVTTNNDNGSEPSSSEGEGEKKRVEKELKLVQERLSVALENVRSLTCEAERWKSDASECEWLREENKKLWEEREEYKLLYESSTRQKKNEGTYEFEFSKFEKESVGDILSNENGNQNDIKDRNVSSKCNEEKELTMQNFLDSENKRKSAEQELKKVRAAWLHQIQSFQDLKKSLVARLLRQVDTVLDLQQQLENVSFQNSNISSTAEIYVQKSPQNQRESNKKRQASITDEFRELRIHATELDEERSKYIAKINELRLSRAEWREKAENAELKLRGLVSVHRKLLLKNATMQVELSSMKGDCSNLPLSPSHVT
eukprot:g2089.t1